MYLAPDGDEAEIADAAATFLADAMPIGRLHKPGSADLSPTLLKAIGALGWFGLTVPHDAGGSGLSSIEHALFFREAGRQCAPLDLLAQSMAAMIADDGDARSQIMTGEVAVALAWADGSGWRVFGTPSAQMAVCVGRTEASLHSMSLTSCEIRPSLDPAGTMRSADKLGPRIAWRGARTPWRLGQLGTAAMLVGLAEAALDLIVGYAKIRETFGRKIGSWQAVRHPCADMAVKVEAARSQLWYAAAALKEGRGDADAHLDAAKHLANTAAQFNSDWNIQLHGGIGVTDEHDAHLLLKHAMVLSRLFGGKRELLTNLLHAKLED